MHSHLVLEVVISHSGEILDKYKRSQCLIQLSRDVKANDTVVRLTV